MKITGNEPAHPLKEMVYSEGLGGHIGIDYLGLTIRQQFAMAAMQGMLANNEGCMAQGSSRSFNPETIAACAVNQSDALIEALNKPRP